MEAVEFLRSTLPSDTIHLVRGAKASDMTAMHFGLGMWVRNELGLWKDGSELLRACGTTDADSGSGIILAALREHLIQTAAPDELKESQSIRRAYDAEREREHRKFMDIVAAKDALITDRRCPFCGKPCPSYRVTCKHCDRNVRDRT